MPTASTAPPPIALALLRWFGLHGRHDLPWQQPIDPYRVWVSEIMLQQTRVTTVIPYFQRFIARFPDVHALAAASLDEVLHLWTGLGYYSRARHLHRTAQHICTQYSGRFPDTATELSQLPGIGLSTAGAIVSIALGQRAPILDGNVKRVLARLRRIEGWTGQRAVERQLWHWADYYTPHERVAEYTQAIMDLGAMVCTPRRPECTSCPLQTYCDAYQTGDVDKYPGKKPRKTLPVHDTRLLMLQTSDDHILLERRANTGVWQDLYCFPELPEATTPTTWCEQQGLSATTIYHLPAFRHTFSHYHLDIQPVHVLLAGSADIAMAETHQLWYNIHHPVAIGLAAPVKRLLTSLTPAPLLTMEAP